MLFRRQFAVGIKRYDTILHQCRTGRVDPAVIRRDDKEQNHHTKQSCQPDRQHLPHCRRQHQLPEKSFILLGFGTAFAVCPKIFLGIMEIYFIGIGSLGKWRINTDSVVIRRNFRN